MQGGKPDVWLEALLLLHPPRSKEWPPPKGNKISGNHCGTPCKRNGSFIKHIESEHKSSAREESGILSGKIYLQLGIWW
jgi:hypothetical protein